MRPSQTFHVLESLEKYSPGVLCRKGVVLSPKDTRITLDVYQQWMMLMCDLSYLPPADIKRTGRRLWYDITRVDVYDLNNVFAECLQLLRLQTVKGFKGLCGQISPHLYALLRSDVEKVSQGDVFAAKRLMQVFAYTGRLSLKDIDLTQQMLDDYIRTESSIKEDFPDNITDALNKIIRRWFKPYGPDEIVPKHGPGGVAGHGRCSIQTKYKDLKSDQALCYAFGDPWWATVCDTQLDRTSETIFVPKSYKSFRTISMEPATLQYFQQGVWHQIERRVENSSYLRDHIGFSEQERNRKLAQQGSLNRDFATIDLSAASDSVSYELVKRLFRGTWLLRYLMVTRSRQTRLPNGEVMKLKKFAPMGSSLCFPVETIIFASVCEHVTRVHRFPGKYSVYGDDIIVPTQCAESVMRILGILGFRVNYDKSFYQQTCWFRESCGGEYCDGYDVTPMRVSRKYADVDEDVRLQKLVDKANEAYRYGYRNLRYFYIRKLKETVKRPYFSPLSLLSDNYTNYHTKKRWNLNLQRVEVLIDRPKTTYNKQAFSSQDEQIRLRYWLESCYGRKTVTEPFVANICRPTMVVRETWVEKPYERLDQPFIAEHLSRGKYFSRRIFSWVEQVRK